MDINTDLGSGWARDPDMALICILDSDVTIVPGGSTGHLNQHGPEAAWVPQHGLRRQARLQEPPRPLVVTRTKDISSDPGYRIL